MKGRVVFLTGAPASGKTTVARLVLERLGQAQVPTLWLDSDDLRKVLTPNATYSDEERDLFYGAIAHLALLGVQGGVTVVISATANRRRYRDVIRAQVPDFTEVLLECPPELRIERDPKGLYAHAREGSIDLLPGFGVPYEAPEHPELILDSGTVPAAVAADRIMQALARPGA